VAELLKAGVTPSVNFDLSDWKITLPTDSSGGISGTAVEVQVLTGYQNSRYFYTASDGAMVFTAPVEGATTSGSKYARSELREMNDGARAAWNLEQGGYMAATLEVDRVPTLADGSQGKVVVGQIHGQDDELVRLYWDKGTVYFVNDRAGAGDKETKFTLLDANGKAPSVSLNEKFSYSIDAQDDLLKVKVYADGAVYSSTTRINDVWDTDTFYFKAGTYLGVNETQGTGFGQTSFYGLTFNHTGAEPTPTMPGSSGPAPSQPAPAPTPTAPAPAPSAPSQGSSPTKAGWPADLDNPTPGASHIGGTSGVDVRMGTSGNDVFAGSAGADTLAGGAGFDVVSYASSKAGVSVDLDKAVQSRQTGDSSYDVLTSIEGIWGSAYNDRLYGTPGDNVLAGGRGDDFLDGDKGADVIIGGSGSDILVGSGGADRFVFTADDGRDTINDFKAGEDKLVFDDMPGVSSVAHVLAHATVSGSSVVLTFGDDSITLLNTNLNTLSGDLLFI
jgi:Ca2+-binding RTX toxin-like protein